MVKIISLVLCVFYQNKQIAPKISEGFQKPEPEWQGLARAQSAAASGAVTRPPHPVPHSQAEQEEETL